MGSRRTIKKEKFAHKYVETGNASEAYRFAYNTARMKPESVKRMASELLKDLYVTSTVEELRDKMMAEIDVSSEKVLRECARIAFFDPRKLFDEDNALRDISTLDAQEASVIASIDVFEVKGDGSGPGTKYIKRIRFNDKLKALDALAKHFGLYNKSDQEQRTRFVIVKDFTGAKTRTNFD
ncbi:Terminase small subunit [Desulfofustis glycolicus DSM 9705]|uniref:Terminase small subunit n=2 Tax=Desulfofustis glycolicus TaxID=51195 RepID=A0A1M5W1H5_9BACT|nr:Terminase small subunit [Desulfofustis glycolicus DSM 9705]